MPKPEKRRIGLKNIAEEAGISVSAVSMALSDSPQISPETKRKVREISQRLGYPGSRQAGNRRSRKRDEREQKRFGFLAIGKHLEDDTLTGILHGLAMHAPTRKVRMEISAVAAAPTANNTAPHVRDYARDLDGLILCGMIDAALLKEVDNLDVPYVVLGQVRPVAEPSSVQPFVRSVYSDALAMGRLAAHRLLANGHKRLAFVSGPMPRGMYNHSWYDGYRLALSDSGVALDPALVHAQPRSEMNMTAVARAMYDMASRPTGLVLPDMHVAAAFLEAMKTIDWRVDVKHDIVVGGRPSMAARYGIDDAQLITEDGDGMASACIDLLSTMSSGTQPERVSVLVPFLTRNLD